MAFDFKAAMDSTINWFKQATNKTITFFKLLLGKTKVFFKEFPRKSKIWFDDLPNKINRLIEKIKAYPLDKQIAVGVIVTGVLFILTSLVLYII
ncbi:hypothetical protein GOV05_04475 [Candidatus Woesearchaeota archaeon]|nr:hypothetical protein [Candidatus Woesearchaeota archaeon]